MVKSRHTTRKRTAKSFLPLLRVAGIFDRALPGCGTPRNGAAVSMAGLSLPPLVAPGCQVDHTPE
ncbi:hypothetical protein ACLB1S_11550 [Escherichia coli]